MKVSVCITTFNESKTIEKLLQSLLLQSRKPDEIIIVDAGSSDGTRKIIRKFKKVKLITSKGASIAKGRNLSVKRAKYPVIVMTDAGCVCEKHWLERIIKPFSDRKTDVVAGFYEMTGKTRFQKALKPFLGIMPSKFDKNKYLPSTRSIAFIKSVWKEAGGFNEKLDRAGEDTDFNIRIVKNGYKIVRVKGAKVYWEVPESLFIASKKFFSYARGDAQMELFTSHNIKVLTVFLRYYIFFFLLLFSVINSLFASVFVFLLLLYLFWSIFKMRNFVSEWRERVYIAIIQVASDISVMLGFLAGTWAILSK